MEKIFSLRIPFTSRAFSWNLHCWISTTPLKSPYVTRLMRRSPSNGVIGPDKTHTVAKLIDNVHCNLSKPSLDSRVRVRAWQCVTTDIYMVLDSNSKKYRFRYYRVKTSKSYTGLYRAFSIVPVKVSASFTSRERIRFTTRRPLPFFFLSNLWVSVVGGFFRCSFRPFRPRTIYITDGGDASALIHYAARWSEDKTKINIRTYIRKGKKTRRHSARSWIIHERRDFHVNEIRNGQTGD